MHYKICANFMEFEINSSGLQMEMSLPFPLAPVTSSSSDRMISLNKKYSKIIP